MKHDRNQWRASPPELSAPKGQRTGSIALSYSAIGQTTRELISAALLFLVATMPDMAIALWQYL